METMESLQALLLDTQHCFLGQHLQREGVNYCAGRTPYVVPLSQNSSISVGRTRSLWSCGFATRKMAVASPERGRNFGGIFAQRPILPRHSVGWRNGFHSIPHNGQPMGASRHWGRIPPLPRHRARVVTEQTLSYLFRVVHIYIQWHALSSFQKNQMWKSRLFSLLVK